MATTTYAPMLPPKPLSPPPSPPPIQGESPTFRPELDVQTGGQGGMGVGSPGSGGSIQQDISLGAGVLKSVLGSAGAALRSQELTRAAQVLGGATGIYKLVNYFSQGAPGGLTGGVNAAGGIGAIVAGLLAVAAQETGDPALQKAAGAAGAATSALGLASTASSIAGVVSSMGGVAAAGAAAGTATAAAAGASAGLGVGLGAAAAPIAAALLISTISGLAGGEDPFGEGIADALSKSQGHYWKFGGDLSQDFQAGRTGLDAFREGLPQVQSREDLQRLFQGYDDYIARTNDWQVGTQFGDVDPFSLGKFPEAGGSRHEGGITGGFTDYIGKLQSAADALYGVVPETGAPSGLSWDQILRQSQAGVPGSGLAAPLQFQVRKPDQSLQTVTQQQFAEHEAQQKAATAAYDAAMQDYWTTFGEGGGQAGARPSSSAIPPEWTVMQNVAYGQPGYNYAATGLRPPGQPAQPSPYWQQLMTPPRPSVPGTEGFLPGTIARTGGMRTGIGQPIGAFGGTRTPLAGGTTGSVSSNITKGLAAPSVGSAGAKQGSV